MAEQTGRFHTEQDTPCPFRLARFGYARIGQFRAPEEGELYIVPTESGTLAEDEPHVEVAVAATPAFDLTEVIHTELLRARRKPDGLLHPSSHLTGSLRHAQLDVAGAPREGPRLMEITLMTGTMWHEWIHDTLRRLGVPYMAEVNLTPWLPKGWGGTADGVVWNPELQGVRPGRLQDAEGRGMRYIVRDGAKEDHRFQTSLYWHGLKKMGLPLAKKVGVFYLPKNDTRNKDEVIEPVLIDFDPIPQRELTQIAKTRFNRLLEYEESLPFVPERADPRAGTPPTRSTSPTSSSSTGSPTRSSRRSSASSASTSTARPRRGT
jgi:hypothetical protein